MGASATMVEAAAQRILDDERAKFGGAKLPAAVADLKPELREELTLAARLALDAPDLPAAAKALYGAVRRQRASWEKITEPAREWWRHRARVARGEHEPTRGSQGVQQGLF